ncbi:MAG: xylulokinase [Alphaproteobacteria bacterium]|nr:xylulokinase [Alphaproteobacteria bacterium]
MYLGLDIGTSAIKAVVCDEAQNIVAQASRSLSVSMPYPLWSEQNPEDWWMAVQEIFTELQDLYPKEFKSVKALGIAGQMHGAVLLDVDGRVIRPAILWNDGRSAAECESLEKSVSDFPSRAGNIAMPGFTAPKLLWVKHHEPDNFKRIHKVLLPKDYIRYCLTGDFVSDMSDAAGSLWMNVATRNWDDELLNACGLSQDHMPCLVEGAEASGHMLGQLREDYGFENEVMVVGGAGDNAAGAIGIGAVGAGEGFLSLGTSGVLFVANDHYQSNPDRAVHSFCHALPGRWHQMSVILSAASCLSWVAKLTQSDDIAALLDEAATAAPSDRLIFLPYLTGERTPHNNPDATGVFIGMTSDTGRGDLVRAVLEGVGFAFADGLDVLQSVTSKIEVLSVIGGGSQSQFWVQMLADILKTRLTKHSSGEVGPAFGAARLARLGYSGEAIEDICTAPEVSDVFEPNPANENYYTEKRARFKKLYLALETEFAA